MPDISVIQADREAADKAFDIAFSMQGEADGIDLAMVSIFAAHRLAERTRIVEVIRNESRDWSDGTETALINLAEAIEHDR